MSDRPEAFYSGTHPFTKDDIKTAQYDARFPNTNQTKVCLDVDGAVVVVSVM